MKNMVTTAPPGFPNWRTLFEYIKTVGMADEQRVELEYPKEETDTVASSSQPEVKPGNPVLYVDEIKARAFEEIYDLLPQASSVAILLDMLGTATKLPGVQEHIKHTMQFLKKIPTRQ